MAWGIVNADNFVNDTKKDEEYDESIVFSGGATPAGYLSDIVKLDLIHGEWQNISNQVKSPDVHLPYMYI